MCYHGWHDMACIARDLDYLQLQLLQLLQAEPAALGEVLSCTLHPLPVRQHATVGALSIVD